MIKATELRIGNHVQLEGDVYQVHEIRNGLQSIELIRTNPNNPKLNEYEECDLDYDDLKPIPLTEEWLVEFGFEKITGCNVIENCYHKNEYSVSFDKCGSITFWVSDEKSIIIEYIHTLQNLYFALTGEELTINN